MWSRIRSILVTRDLDLKSSNDAANKVLKKKETLQVIRRVLPIRQDIASSFCFTGAETEIHKIKDDNTIIRQTNLDRRGLRPFPIICRLLHPPPLLSRYRLPLNILVWVMGGVFISPSEPVGRMTCLSYADFLHLPILPDFFTHNLRRFITSRPRLQEFPLQRILPEHIKQSPNVQSTRFGRLSQKVCALVRTLEKQEMLCNWCTGHKEVLVVVHKEQKESKRSIVRSSLYADDSLWDCCVYSGIQLHCQKCQ